MAELHLAHTSQIGGTIRFYPEGLCTITFLSQTVFLVLFLLSQVEKAVSAEIGCF